MGILNMFNPGAGEQKQQMEAEKRHMSFQREQNTIAITAPEEQTELMHQEGKSDLLRWQQDLDDEMLELVARLRGMAKVNNEFKIVEGVTPLCNDKFITDVVIPQCKPFLSRNLINSTFTEESILRDLKNTSNDITANMADGFDIYGINFQNYDIILRAMKNVIKAGAYRALNGFTKNKDSQIHKILESTHNNENNQQMA